MLIAMESLTIQVSKMTNSNVSIGSRKSIVFHSYHSFHSFHS